MGEKNNQVRRSQRLREDWKEQRTLKNKTVRSLTSKDQTIAVIDHTVIRVRYISTCYKTEYALHTQTSRFSRFQNQEI